MIDMLYDKNRSITSKIRQRENDTHITIIFEEK